ncbi:hypothetical protein ACFFWC_30405 [Plantactinospora siamensis]|uniref:Restriction endonuclease n=1 Tax=Plantactinospora siamensis TaxID=555372 RepID=A0ABV6P7M7_9ACTN
MPNEAVTEDIVRERLAELGYFDPAAEIVVERQQSAIAAVKRLLRQASKTGGSGVGYPDFIITSPKNPDYVIVVECKASRARHQSSTGDRIAEFAVDGALHYASFLSKEYNTIALGVSGESLDELLVSTFVHVRGAMASTELKSPTGAELDHLIPFSD